PSQPPELLALLAGQPLAQAAIDLRLAHPVTQRLRRAAQVGRDDRDRAARAAHQLDRLTPKLRRIRRTCTWHLNSPPSGPCSAPSAQLSTKPGEDHARPACGDALRHIIRPTRALSRPLGEKSLLR